jgi:integrase
MGGPLTGPHRPGPEKRAARKARAALVRRIADAVRPAWEERMRGVDQHCLRMTHRTWALSAGVPEILIDRQLGHTSPAGDAALNAAWSAVGRAHYTDMNFLSLDARRSADAVRGMLDRAEADLQEVVGRNETALGMPQERTRTGTA